MQFEKAEYQPGAGKTCALCQSPIALQYYHLSGQDICPDCASKVEVAQMRPTRALLVRGILYALGAAAACSLVYTTILIISNYELAIAAIAVGWLIGQAARRGTNGLGGRPVQYVAAAATYLAICFSLFFQLTYAGLKEGKFFTLTGFVGASIVSLLRPFLELASSGVSGVLSILILFFGMQQAWKLTGNLEGLALMGPYTVEPPADTQHG